MALRWTILALLLPALGAAAKTAPVPEYAVPLRAVELPGPLERADLVTHLDYLYGLGFNAVWVQAQQISANPLGDSPDLNAASRRLAAWCSRRDAGLFVAVDPTAGGARGYALSDAELVEALRRFARTLRLELDVADIVLSFEGAPVRLSEIRDVLAFGLAATPAHVDLVTRLRDRIPRKTRLWFEPAVPFVGSLPASVGLVWRGGENPAPSVDAGELERLWKAVGKRPTLLRDRYPANQSGRRMPLSHNLGPLRDRDPALATRLSGHVSVAMNDWGASRLTLATVADWLRDPQAYDAKPSWERAMRTLAGDDPQALEALRTQALEWGGPIGGPNHHTALTDNPGETSRVLRDPALVSRWKWILTRYPERMESLRGLADVTFRDELLEVMARRLAIARAIPPTREILARQAAGRSDLMGLIAELNRLRANTAPASARLALERFLAVAGLIELLDAAEDAPTARD